MSADKCDKRRRRKIMSKLPSETIEDFLKLIRSWETEYYYAFEAVGKEDKRLQDLLHELEFTENFKEKNQVATKLKDSRKTRRENKDRVLMLESVVKFFADPQNRKTLNQMEQLLGRQRKQEKILLSERTYTPRINVEKVD